MSLPGEEEGRLAAPHSSARPRTARRRAPFPRSGPPAPAGTVPCPPPGHRNLSAIGPPCRNCRWTPGHRAQHDDSPQRQKNAYSFPTLPPPWGKIEKTPAKKMTTPSPGDTGQGRRPLARTLSRVPHADDKQTNTFPYYPANTLSYTRGNKLPPATKTGRTRRG